MKKPATDPQIAIGYKRASTGKQAISPEVQHAAIERWAKARGITVVAWFSESGVSGSDALEDCPQLLAALDALREHRAGVLVVAKRDRLGRDVVKMGLLGALVERAGATILSAAGEGEGDQPGDKLMRTLVDAFSAYEVQIIRARTRGALALKKTRGEMTGTPPFGYRTEAIGPVQTRNGVTRKTAMLVPDPVEQATIATVRELRASGLSLARICAELDARGVKPRGGKWHANSIWRALNRTTGT